ncbi:MAG: alpha/beta fold hydrolase [Deltaproteobacteria bacterium]|nr:alpha/beta fold hydrolase [Deltaproteobacteria bacterium]
MEASVDGIRLHYELAGEAGPLVVLTHGLGGRFGFFDPHVEALTRRYRVLRWDLRGAGGSSAPPGPYTPALFARDLAGLLDALGEPSAHLVGHSGGGVVTQRFALDFPRRASSLVLVSTSSEVGPVAAAAWSRLADSVEQRGFGSADRDPDPRGFGSAFVAAHPEIVRAFAEQTRANDPRAYAASARAFGSYNFTNELARLHAPTLILQGLADQMTPPGGSVILSRRLPRARLVMVPDAGHNLPIEMPHLLTTAILSFLGGLELAVATD